MSLVSSLSGVIAADERVSELEYRYSKMLDVIDCITKKATDIGQAISGVENKISNDNNAKSIFYIQLQSTHNPAQKSYLMNEITRITNAQMAYQTILMNLNNEKHQYDATEKQLMKEKTELEVLKTKAAKDAESLQKMIEPAIQRLVIKS